MRYTVEQIEVGRARDDLLRVWRDNLPVFDGGEGKLAWTYERAPLEPLSPLLLVARRGEEREVVGSAGVVRRAFALDGRTSSAGLMADLAVDRDHRRLLPALSLVQRARQAAQDRVDFIYGFPNHKAEPLFLRAGYTRIGGLTRYVRVLRHADYAERIVGSKAAARAAGLFADAAARARRLPSSVEAAARYRLTFTDAADERAGEVWDAAAPRYGIVGVRDPEFLCWRLCDHPETRHRFAWLEERRGGAARAYAAVAPENGALAVRDFFGPPEALGPLFDRLASWARGEGAQSLALRFFGDARVTDALRAAGFQARDSSRAVIVDPLSAGDRRLGDPQRWYLTDADEDI